MMRLSRSGYYYKSKKDDSEVIEALRERAEQKPAHGFRKMYSYLRRKGRAWNRKKVYRVYKLLKLHKRRKMKRRVPVRIKQPLVRQLTINCTWSVDFMSDSLASGRKIRTFNVIDDCSREALAIEIDTSLPAERIVRILDRLISLRGKPQILRTDNGPEFTSQHFELWAQDNGIQIQYIQPGRPMQNGYIERFNGTYRKEVLDAYLFFELEEVRDITEQWIWEYNNDRSHEGIGNQTPAEWSKRAVMDLMENFPTPQGTAEVYHNSTTGL